jgi:ubiquinone/menaquinone biosynthesis C-methylase UbiE
MTKVNEREYVLGTGDNEIARLELQHGAWRADAATAWQRAAFRPGDTILDVGCGPGFATLDLATLVGPDGRVVAIDQSHRFLQYLGAQCVARGVTNVTTRAEDLETFDFDGVHADAAWLRWVLAFVPNPYRVLSGVVGTLRVGGRIVVHEYFAYETWKLVPQDAAYEEFVTAVMASWRARGGEPNVGLSLIPWLERLGLTIEHTRTMTYLVNPRHHRWHWPTAFAAAGIERLVKLGDVDSDAAHRMRRSVKDSWNDGAWMMTPGVVEVVARK